VSSSSDEIEISENSPVFMCKLTSDHRFLQFDDESDATSVEPVELTNIQSLQILSTHTDSMGNTVASGIGIHFNDPRGESQRMKLEATPTANKRQAMCWVAAIQKAMKLLYESRNNQNN